MHYLQIGRRDRHARQCTQIGSGVNCDECHLEGDHASLQVESDRITDGPPLQRLPVEIREALGTLDSETPPRQVGRCEAAPLRRPHQPAMHAKIRPSRVDQVTVAMHTEQAKRGISGTRPTRLPVADGAKRNPKELGGIIPGEATENTGIPELLSGDAETPWALTT